MFFLAGWLVALILAVIHVLVAKPPTTSKKLEVFLFYQMVFCIGLAGLIGFYGHCFMYEKVAKGIGWVPHRQFQFELGVSELGWAIAGLLAVFIRRPLYWLGISITPCTMYVLAGVQHMREMVAQGNYAPYNVWPGVVDLTVPLTLAILFTWYYFATRTEQQQI